MSKSTIGKLLFMISVKTKCYELAFSFMSRVEWLQTSFLAMSLSIKLCGYCEPSPDPCIVPAQVQSGECNLHGL